MEFWQHNVRRIAIGRLIGRRGLDQIGALFADDPNVELIDR